MKKLIALCLILLMLLPLIGCGEDEERKINIEKDLYSIYEELRPIYNSDTTNEEVRDYIAGVADREEIFNKKLPGDSLILSKRADPHFESVPSTTMQCTISTNNRKRDAQVAAILFTVLINTEEHGEVSVIFTGEKDGDSYGASSLTNNYLNADNLINVRYADKADLITDSPCEEEYTMSSKAEIETPETAGKAYKLSFTTKGEALSEKEIEDYPNPIMTLGLLLSQSRNDGINLRIASFEGSISPEKTPVYAEAVVVIQPDDQNRLTKNIESGINKFDDKYSGKDPDPIYEYEPVELPEYVLTHDSTSRLLSLIYTINEGLTVEEEEAPASFSGIEKISVSDRILLAISGKSLSPKGQQKMRSAFESIAKLNNYSFSHRIKKNLWESPAENLLADSLVVAAGNCDLKLEPGPSMEVNDCSIFTTKKEDLQAVSFGVNIQQGTEISETLVVYLESLHQSSL